MEGIEILNKLRCNPEYRRLERHFEGKSTRYGSEDYRFRPLEARVFAREDHGESETYGIDVPITDEASMRLGQPDNVEKVASSDVLQIYAEDVTDIACMDVEIVNGDIEIRSAEVEVKRDGEIEITRLSDGIPKTDLPDFTERSLGR